MTDATIKKKISSMMRSVIIEGNMSLWSNWSKHKKEFLLIRSKDALMSIIERWCDRFGLECQKYFDMVDDPDTIDSAREASYDLKNTVMESSHLKNMILYPFVALVIFNAMMIDVAHGGITKDKQETVSSHDKHTDQNKIAFEKGGYVSRKIMKAIQRNNVDYYLLLNFYDPEKYPVRIQYAMNKKNAMDAIYSIIHGYRDGTSMKFVASVMSCPELIHQIFEDDSLGYEQALEAVQQVIPNFKSVI